MLTTCMAPWWGIEQPSLIASEGWQSRLLQLMTWCTGLARLCPRGQTARCDGVGKIADGDCAMATARQAILPTLRHRDVIGRQSVSATLNDDGVSPFQIARKLLGIEQRRGLAPRNPRLELRQRLAIGRIAKRKSAIVGKRGGDEIGEPGRGQNAGRHARRKGIARQA